MSAVLGHDRWESLLAIRTMYRKTGFAWVSAADAWFSGGAVSGGEISFSSWRQGLDMGEKWVQITDTIILKIMFLVLELSGLAIENASGGRA